MLKTGVDIVEITRIKKFVDENIDNLERVFSPHEIEYCNSKNKNKYESFAVRFAAKEAVMKALDDKSLALNSISVVNLSTGKPSIVMNNKDIKNTKNISLSLSHCENYAIAFVVIED